MTEITTAAADINLNGLKGSLALEPRWVAFREEPVPGKERKSKVPYGPSGFPAAIDNKENWTTREEAERGAQGLSVDDRRTGIGIVLGMWTTPVGGIDLDTCINEGELEPWAATIVNAMPGYWEISINGEGLHALFRFKREDSETLRAALKQYGTSHNRPSEKPHKPGVSTYLGSRYFTVSEQLWPGASETIREVPTADLLRVIEQLAPAVAPPRTQAKPKDESRSGFAWNLACRTVAFGLGKRAFLNALYDDDDGAAWAEEDCPRNENRTWERALAARGWTGQWKRRGKRGEPLSNLHNALLSLRNAEELRELFGYDEMLRAEMLLKPPPGSREEWNGPRPVRDTDVSAVQEWLQANWLVTIGKETTFQAVERVAAERSFHPVKDYLRRLEWDGVERLDSWLATYFGTERSAYTAAIGRMFLVAMVARVFQPGCQADYMPILEGEQGAQKSSALRVLAGQWFSDNLPPVRTSADHDVSQHLRGKWLIEIGEMSAMDKADSAALKSFVTRQVEQFRPSYGRKEAHEPRQCLFVGTTNEEVYLRDATGGRRFWPVLTGAIDLVALKRDRDQLFAEAVARFERGEQWWPDREFEKTYIQPEQEARYEADAWEDKLRTFLASENRTSVPEIASKALGFKDAQVGTRDTRRITAILRRFGFTQEKDKEGRRFWMRPGDPFTL